VVCHNRIDGLEEERTIATSHLLNSLASIAIVIGLVIPNQTDAIAQMQVNPTDWSTLLDRATRYQSEDRYQEAEALYRQILSPPRPASMNDTMYYIIHIELGQNLQIQGRLTDSIEVLQGVLNAAPEDADIRDRARYALDGVLEQQRTSEQSIARGLQAIERDPTDPWGYRDLATGLALQGQLEQGLTVLASHFGPLSPDRAIELARAANSSTVYSNVNFSNRSNYLVKPQAIALYRQLVARYPDYQPAQWELLDVLDVWGDPEEAIAAYREAIDRQPSDTLLSRQLVRALERAGKPLEAIAVYEQLIEQRPVEPAVYGELGALLEQTQQPDRALQIYLKAIELFPDDSPNDRRCHVVKMTSYDRLVQLLAQQNRLEQSITEIEQLNLNFTAEIYENLALALAYENYDDLAEVVYRQLRDRYPDADRLGGGQCG
jgi:tetratricopeptide (TPR) repeat protein